MRTTLSDNDETSLTESLFILFVLVPAGLVFGGYVLGKLWLWFLVPVFTALPVLTLGQAVGLYVVLDFLRLGLATTIHKKEARGVVKALAQIFALAIVLGLGFVVHLIIS